MQQGQAPTLGVAVLTSKQAEVVVPLATAVAALTAEALQAKVGHSCNNWAAGAMADCYSCCPPVLHACTCARQRACCPLLGCQLLTSLLVTCIHIHTIPLLHMQVRPLLESNEYQRRAQDVAGNLRGLWHDSTRVNARKGPNLGSSLDAVPEVGLCSPKPGCNASLM